MTNDIIVSVIIPTYNHEKYIKQAIQSVLCQKVDFNYEVLIGEDFSTDATADVLRKLEPNLPYNYFVFYRDKNWGSKKNFEDLYQRSKGKYLIVLEGDDFWIYDKKLQEQVNFLETHEDYIAVAHNILPVDKNGKEIEGFKFLECKKDDYTLFDWREGIYPGQTATILLRNYYRNNTLQDIPISVSFVGDIKRNFLLTAYGKIRCIQEKWSAYRYVTDEGASFTATCVKNADWYYRQYVFYKDIKNYADTVVKTKEAMMVAETAYLVNFLRAVNKKARPELTYGKWLEAFWNAKYKLSYLEHRINRIKISASKHFK